VFGTNMENIPADVPYVGPLDPSAVQLPSSLGRIKRVGIS